jgi:regulatory protein
VNAKRRSLGAPAQAPEDEARLYRRALRLLAAHDRTAADLRRRLEQAGEPDAVARVIARLEAQHYLDDRRYAQAWTEREALERGGGARLVRAGLRAHGVAEPLVEEAAARAAEAEADTALALCRKAAARLRGLAPEVRVRRLAGLLARRGYRPAVVYASVRAALAEDRLGEAAEGALEALALADDPAAAPETKGSAPDDA